MKDLDYLKLLITSGKRSLPLSDFDKLLGNGLSIKHRDDVLPEFTNEDKQIFLQNLLISNSSPFIIFNLNNTFQHNLIQGSEIFLVIFEFINNNIKVFDKTINDFKNKEDLLNKIFINFIILETNDQLVIKECLELINLLKLNNKTKLNFELCLKNNFC